MKFLLSLFKTPLPGTQRVEVIAGALEGPLVFDVGSAGLYELDIVLSNADVQRGNANLFVVWRDKFGRSQNLSILGADLGIAIPSSTKFLFDPLPGSIVQIGVSSLGPTNYSIAASLTQVSQG